MTLYLALLRGINVGGKNIIKMTALAACFESRGFEHVRTYIQSGNVILSAGEPDKTRLTRRIEDALSQTFDYDSSVVLRSYDEMKDIVSLAPQGFGSQPDEYRYNVIYLKEPLTAAEAMQSVTTREGVDRAFAGDGVLYFSHLMRRASQSRLTRIIGLPVYQSMTIRNWNTTTKLLNMMEEVESS
jgi:uncharacterized protein (DUF1697 family)